jgi:superkiller protein 3
VRNLALVERDRGRYQQSLLLFKRARQLSPESASVLVGLGSLYARMDSLGQAADRFRAAIGVDARNADAHYGLADLYVRKARIEDALKEARSALALEPASGRNHALIAFVYEHNQAGVRYGDGYRSADAIRAYKKALRLEPANAAYHYSLGVLYGRQDSWAHARGHFLEALAIDSTHAGVRKWLPIVETRYRESNPVPGAP